MRKSRLSRTALAFTGRALAYTLLLAGALSMIFPFVWAFLTAVKPNQGIYSWPPVLVSRPLQLQNFATAWTKAPFSRFFVNSVIISVTTTAAMLILCSAAGFAFSKYRFHGRTTLFVCCLGTMMVPFQVRMIPLFQMMSSFKLLDTLTAMILPEVVGAFGIFLVKQYMSSIPDEFLGAGRIDGCSEIGLLARIMIPLSKPVLAVLAALTFQWQWNSFIWPLIVARTERMFTLQVGMALFRGQYHTEWNLLMAVVVIGIVPMVIFAVFCQRYLVKGVVMSGMKG